MGSKPKYTRSLNENPAQALAEMILTAGSHGAIAAAMRDILARLPTNGRHNNTLTRAGADFVREQLLKNHGSAIKAMDEILNEGVAVSGHKTNVVQFMDTTELYAGSRPRTSGDVIEEYAEVKKQPAIATRDVLQQTPKLLDEDVDQYHYESTREERPTNKTATGIWQTAERRELGVGEFEVVNDLGHHTYVIREEEVTIMSRRTS